MDFFSLIQGGTNANGKSKVRIKFWLEASPLLLWKKSEFKILNLITGNLDIVCFSIDSFTILRFCTNEDSQTYYRSHKNTWKNYNQDIFWRYFLRCKLLVNEVTITHFLFVSELWLSLVSGNSNDGLSDELRGWKFKSQVGNNRALLIAMYVSFSGDFSTNSMLIYQAITCC